MSSKGLLEVDRGLQEVVAIPPSHMLLIQLLVHHQEMPSPRPGLATWLALASSLISTFAMAASAHSLAVET